MEVATKVILAVAAALAAGGGAALAIHLSKSSGPGLTLTKPPPPAPSVPLSLVNGALPTQTISRALGTSLAILIPPGASVQSIDAAVVPAGARGTLGYTSTDEAITFAANGFAGSEIASIYWTDSTGFTGNVCIVTIDTV